MTSPYPVSSRRLAGPALVLLLLFTACGRADAGAGSGGTDAPAEATGTADASRLFGQMASGADSAEDGEAEGGSAGAGRAAPDTARGEEAPRSPEGTSPPESPSRRGPAPPPATGQSPPGSVDVGMLGFNRGDPEAPIRVIEFSDFGCGYCRKFHLETFPTLEDEFIETGKVVWKYVPFVLGIFPNSVEAATAGECAGEQGRFASLRDRLFQDQPEWRKTDEPYDLFARYAEDEGLDVDRFRTCLEEGWVADRVRRSARAGHRIGVRGTPTFVVDGFPLQGALPTSVFRDIFNRLLEEDGAGSPP